MRFGQNFHQFLVPEWAPFYVPYPLLKKLFKKAAGNSIGETVHSDFSDVYTLLTESIDSFNNFHNKNCNLLRERQRHLCMKYASVHGESIFLRKKDENCHEEEYLLQAVAEIRDDFEKLQDYFRVNEEAIHRIYVKIEKSTGFVEQFHQRHKASWVKSKIGHHTCLNFMRTLDDLTTSVIGAPSDREAPSKIMQSCYESMCDQSLSSPAERHALHCAIRNDEPSTLANLIKKLKRNGAPQSHFKKLLYALAELSVISHSQLSVRYLLSEAFPANDVVLDHNLLNHVITICSREYGSKMSDGLSNEWQCVTGRQGEERGVDLFIFAVCRLGIHQKNALLAEDTFGRLCLHYGAIYGLPPICQSILNCAKTWGQGFSSRMIFSLDCRGCTPFHYAVTENHVAVAEIFLEILVSGNQSSREAQCQNLWNQINDLLVIAIRYQHDDMVFLLGKAQIEFQSSRSIHGESALYVAAQIGREDYVKVLLENGNILYLDMPETLQGWTPLFIACVEGHKTVAQLLLQAGANQEIYDHLGWMAKEHAALRGYLSLAEMLQRWDMSQLTGGPASRLLRPVPADKSRHRFETDQVIVNLGSLRIGKKVKAVDLEGPSPEKTNYTSKLASLDMSISVEGSDGTLLKLPILSDVVNEPFVFPVLRPSEARLVFKFFRVDDSCEGLQLVGSAAALLESGGDCFGANRESLVRERTIPILEKKTMDVMGTVTFTFVIARPVMNLNLPPSAHRYTTEGALQLVGHRGLGQNTTNHSRIQLGENTIESFLSAAKQGASCVELTRDLVPVIYHDFSLSESGTDIPIHDLSSEQFMYANQIQSPRGMPTQELKNTSAQYMSDESEYPRLHEAVEAGVAPISIEINTFIDEILAHVSRVKSGRRIMLSSFSPEVCILLAIKQNTYPVLFITNAGKLPISDMEIRASSLQAAVRFAKRWDLTGIVFSSETLIMCPRLVGYVKKSGLICGSYGPLNNISENSKIQHKAGIQMLMVDEVGLISKALNGTANCSITD
ncbi:Glycerophosphodiester phosphodiesterase [Aspergillus affinis]|uniref:Glycerophosphodiester phosphodiesterase n=1 Tax=Aspergillus affinis TaxID=1070780 RepID=UPI0022FE0AE5|nr:Glycerophosphodiester phosphodiesterase [Aspergillus affinis]KAI9040138.1 Glycerophosphodiester phosphodiesterase [Aspergillus affinis]